MNDAGLLGRGRAAVARATLLIQRGHLAEARQELARHLQEHPEEAYAIALDSICLSSLGDAKKGLERAELAISKDPELVASHYARGVALLGLERIDAALRTATEILRIDPEDTRGHYLRARTCLTGKRFAEALDACELGLELDPEDESLLHMKVEALRMLGRGEEADCELQRVVALSPASAAAHAQLGWRALETNRVHDAAGHFRESLRLDPQRNESARQGLIEALKARNPVYRLVLGYFLRVSKLSSGAQWGLILGAYFGFRLVRLLTQKQPGLEPLAYAVTAIYVTFVFTTWLADSLFDLMLRLSPEGKHLLNDEERLQSNTIGAALGLGAIGLGLGLGLGDQRWVIPGVGLVMLCFPLTLWFADARRRRSGVFVALLVALLGAATALAFALPDPKIAHRLFITFLIGTIASTWVGSALLVRGQKSA